MAERSPSPRLRRKAGLERLAGLLGDLRALDGLRETRPGNFLLGSHPLLHFHFEPDGRIVADVRSGDGRVERFDVSDPGGQQELLALVESSLDE